MKQLGIEICIQNNCLTLGSRKHLLHTDNDLLWLKWKACDQVLYSETELRKLHRASGHASAKALAELLKRARPTDPYVRKALETVVKECLTCSRNSSKPRRFKLTVGTEKYRFNNIVVIDIVHIDSHKVLHCVNESTHFQAATVLRNMKSNTVWRALMKCWSSVYLGPPDFLRVDHGSNLVLAECKSCAQAEGISVLEAPIECPQTMSHVERYHTPLRTAF